MLTWVIGTIDSIFLLLSLIIRTQPISNNTLINLTRTINSKSLNSKRQSIPILKTRLRIEFQPIQQCIPTSKEQKSWTGLIISLLKRAKTIIIFIKSFENSLTNQKDMTMTEQ